MDGSSYLPSVVNKEDEFVNLPPGFRFHPTDEEIIIHYLMKKVMDRRFVPRAIGEADLNKCEPWDLQKKAKTEEKEWFFCQKDRKYPTGTRTNRATESGYWKATGKDREIYKGKNCLVGMKKTLVFYKGRAPKGEKTNWIMREYRLEGNLFNNDNFPRAAKEEWVVCRIFHKNTGVPNRRNPDAELSRNDSFMESLLDNPILPPLMDISYSLENPKSEMQHGPKNFLVPSQNYSFNNTYENCLNNPGPNPILCHKIAPSNSTFPSQESSRSCLQHQDRVSWILSCPTTFPLRDSGEANIRFVAPNQGMLDPGRGCKMEQFSTTSVSHNNGVCSEMATEISSVVSKRDTESMKPIYDLEGFPISPDISELDSLWSY